jgi:type III secretion system needle length determinant
MPQVNTPQPVTPDPSYEEITQDAAEPTLSADLSSVKAFNELLKKSAVQAQDQLQVSPQWRPFTAQMFKDDTTTSVPSMEFKNTTEDTTGTLPVLSNTSKTFTQTTTQHPDTYINQSTPKEDTVTSTPFMENKEVPLLSKENSDTSKDTNTYSDNANSTFASKTKVENEFLAPHIHMHLTSMNKFAGATTGKMPVENRPTASQVDETAYATQNNPLPVGLPSSTSSGDTILNNLQSFSQTSSNIALDHSHRLQQIKTELVDQILISSNALENKQVVKIALNPQLLAGTEVNLQKQGNNLQVTFITTNAQSETFLVNTHTNLQAHLVERLNHFQDISVSVNGAKG